MTDRLHRNFARSSFTIETIDNVIFSEFTGQWAKPITTHYVKAIKDKVYGFEGMPWFHLVLLDKWEMSSKESAEAFSALGAWCYGHNIKATLFVHQPNPIKRYQLEQMIPNKATGHRTCFFDTQAEACDFLATLDTSPPNLWNRRVMGQR